MNRVKVLPLVALIGLAACDEIAVTPAAPRITIPDEVVALAGPNQDLTTAFFNEADRCYWYQHRGVVETTPLPLRTASGSPICAPREETPAPAQPAA